MFNFCINIPLKFLLKIQKRKCITFLISDFQAKDYTTNLKLAKQKHELVAIAISDPREKNLPDVGFIHLKDAESGETILINTSNREMAKHFTSYEEKRRKNLKKKLHSIGVDTINIDTGKSLTDPIIKYFKIREKRH